MAKNGKKSAKIGSNSGARSSGSDDSPMDSSSGAAGEIEQAPNLRDLILSANAALGGLDEETATDLGETADAAEPAPEAPAKKKKNRKSPASDTPVENRVEWNEGTSKLDFVEEPATEPVELNPFEELARRVAETAAQNTDDADEATDSELAAADAEAAAVLPTDDETIARTEDEVAAAGFVEGEGDAPEIFAEEGVVEAAELGEHTALEDAIGEPMVEGETPSIDATADAGADTESAPGSENWFAEPDPNSAPMEQVGFGDLEDKIDAAENDADPEPTEFISQDLLISTIESLLFATDKPVSVATIKQIFKGSNIRSKDITRALDLLASEYASPTRGVTLEEVGGGYQLRTKSDNAEYLRRLAKVRPFKLSGPSLEVMAIIAYRQPITKHEIDEIRGVESGHLLRALMERGLICFNGKSDLPGKPMTYGSTRKFLETFGLRNLRELPTLSEIDEILPEGIGETEEKEKLSDLTDRLSTELTSSYSEGEDELEKINAQLKQVDTSSEFFEQEKQREREKREAERAQDIREKIVLGDAVEDKDRRWLERYEAKLLLPTEPAHPSDVEEPGHLTSAIEQLTSDADEAHAQAAESAEGEDSGEDLLHGDANDESVDDLEAHQDWDDESEA